jgi:hypothetical protein
MDCARSALRLGAKNVHLIYRRTREDMPADAEEIKAAEEEGVIFHFLTNPSRVVSENGSVTGIELVNMRSTDADAQGRRNVEAIPGTEHFMPCGTLIAAIGQQVQSGVIQARRRGDHEPLESRGSGSDHFDDLAPWRICRRRLQHRPFNADPRHGQRSCKRRGRSTTGSNSGMCASRRERECATS